VHENRAGILLQILPHPRKRWQQRQIDELDFVPPQASGIQEKKRMQKDCAQRYHDGSDPIRITENCVAEVSKTRHE
jgi:hypothetical protein